MQAHFVFVEPNAEQLDKLRDMIEHGTLTTHVSAVLPLEEAAKAHQLIETQHTRGKIVSARYGLNSLLEGDGALWYGVGVHEYGRI